MRNVCPMAMIPSTATCRKMLWKLSKVMNREFWWFVYSEIATMAITSGSTKRTPSERRIRCPSGAERIRGADGGGASVSSSSDIGHLHLDQTVLGGFGAGDLADGPPRAHD